MHIDISKDCPKTSRQVQKAIDELRERFNLGEDVRKAANPRNGKRKYGAATVPAFARNNGVSMSLIYDARQLAAAYTRDQLKRVIDLAVKHNAVIGVSHLIELMRLENRVLRRCLEEQMAYGRWTVVRLKREIRRALA